MSFQQENTPYVFFKKSISPRNWNTGSPSGNTKTPLKKKKLSTVCVLLFLTSLYCLHLKPTSPWSYPHPKNTKKPPCDPSHVAAVFRLHQQQALVGTNGLPWHRHHQRIVFGAQDQSWTRDLPEHLEEVRVGSKETQGRVASKKPTTESTKA